VESFISSTELTNLCCL